MASSPGNTLKGTNAGKMRDFAPEVPPAGKVIGDLDGGVAGCVKHDRRPDTPPGVSSFRKTRIGVGQQVVHPGKSRDAPPPDIAFGKKNVYNDEALHLIQADARGVFLQKQTDIKEGIYQTNKTEPLGHTRTDRPLPAKARDPLTKFGKATKGSESAKTVIYPFSSETEDEEHRNHRRYCQTHNSYGAGEQKDRNYDWKKQGVNPAEHRFGYVHPPEVEGVKQSMTFGRDVKTTIVKKTIEDFKDYSKDELSKPKNQGFGDERDLPGDFVFGKRNQPDEWGVRECMTKGVPAEALDDQTLGKSTRPGYRNDTTLTRTFGVPSVRTDIPRPRSKKVTNNNNYGDDSNAAQLLRPSKYLDKNVHEEDFLVPISKEDMADLADKAGFGLDDEEFQQAWNLASAMSDDGSVSIETFRQAVDDLAL